MQSNSDGKASPGSPFRPPAVRIWNNMVEAGKAYSDSRLNNEAPNPIRPRETDIIKAKNTSGAARRLGEILRISGKAIETVTDENKWLLGVEPTDDGYFGILKEPAAISGIASLQVSGCCMALVNVTDASHTRATSADTEYVLQSGDDGPIEILFAPDGTGEKTCVVRFAAVTARLITIRFQIVEPVYCEACTATGLVLSRPPGMATVPGEYGGMVNLADRLGCFLNEANVALIGRKGYATYLTSSVEGPCPGMDETSYEITALCCAESQCNGESA